MCKKHSFKKSLVLIGIFFGICSMAWADSNEAERLYLKGRALSADRMYQEAIDTLKTAYSLASDNHRIIILLGDIYLKVGHLPGAEQAYKQLIEIEPKNPKGYVKIAELYWHWDKYREALEYLNLAQKLSSPPHSDVYNWKGQVLRSLERYEESDSVLEEGIKYYPDHPLILANYGTTRLFLEDSVTARVYIDSAYAVDPNSVFVINTQVSFNLFTGDIERASEFLNMATTTDPDDPFTRSNVQAYTRAYRELKISKSFQEGNNYFNKSLYGKARESYETAIEEDSAFFEAYVNLGFTYIHLGEPDKAVVAFEKGLSLMPNYAPAYMGWGDALVGLGDIDGAIEKYAKAMEVDPENKNYQEIYEEALEVKKELESQNE